MAWYFAYATLLSDGTIMVDLNVSKQREVCEEVAASSRQLTGMLVSACEQFDVPPTVIISGDRKRLTLQR